jgi:hypothetical protein
MHLCQRGIEQHDFSLRDTILHNPRVLEYDSSRAIGTLLTFLATQNITSTLCQVPIRDRTGLVSIAGAVGGGIAVFVVALRLIARLPRFGGKFGMDDAVMIVVVVCF